MANRLFQIINEAEAYIETSNPKLSCKVATTTHLSSFLGLLFEVDF